MLTAIKKFFDQQIKPHQAQDVEHRLRLATAALMIEMMRQDGHVHDSEAVAVRTALMQKFALTAEETETLFNLAQKEAHHATDFHQFTSLIARNFTAEEKFRVIEQLWVIAYADGHLDPHEEHMIRRIADLIYVPHVEFIRAKHRVLEGAHSL